MDVLFSTLLFVNGRSTLYSVTFHDEQYHFTPEDKDGGDEFILVREHDEWHDQESFTIILPIFDTNRAVF